MKNKIIITITVLIALIALLWVSGVVPKQVARISATNYFQENFSEIQLEFASIEWSSAYGDYVIQFKDKENNIYGFTIGPWYFPTKLGQGLFGFEECYIKSSEKCN